MLYIIDTADLKAIKHCVKYYPIAGVTTNPSIIAKEKTDFYQLVSSIREIIGDDKMLHIQTTQNKAEKIIDEAKLLKEKISGNIYIKIPISEEGLKATTELKKIGIPVTMTAIFTSQQALISAIAGAEFVAPYVNRLDNILGDGVNVISDIVSEFKTYNISSRVLAASFKNCQQVSDVAKCGCHLVTVPPEILQKLISHPLTDFAVNQFNTEWEAVYKDKTIFDLL